MKTILLLIDRLHAFLRRAEAWVEEHPRRAGLGALLLTLLLVAPEVAYWPLNDFPGASWHHPDPGIEIKVVQARAPMVGWKELAGFWYGRLIHGNEYYQPLTSWLFVGEYHLFGLNNRTWAIVNLGLHLGVVAALLWTGAVVSSGPLLRRLGIGVLAALFLAAPNLADRSIQAWILGWWPAQPDLLSALFGLALLASVTLYCRTGERRWAVLAPFLFWVGVCFKETAYVAGVGACLFLLRQRKAWPLLAVLALQGVAMFLFRKWAIGAVGVDTPLYVARVGRHLRVQAMGTGSTLTSLTVPLFALAVCAVITWALRRSWGPGARTLLAAAVYSGINFVWYGPPWEPGFMGGIATLAAVAGFLLLAGGVALACREWPIPELIVVWLLAWYFHWSFPPVLGWHGYWNSVFGSLVMATGVVTAAGWLGDRALRWRERQSPAPLVPAPE